MNCPRCVQRIHRTAAACPHCGFSLDDADRMFGAGEVAIDCLEDTSGVLRSRERERVVEVIERFREVFPQLFLAVHTDSFAELASLRQYGFWLINRAAFRDVPLDRPNEAGILLLIDPESHAASLSFGYLLDPFLTEDDTFRCLSRAHPYLLEGDYAGGIEALGKALTKVLKKRSRQARRDRERFERRCAPPPPVGELARRIRDGHRVKNVAGEAAEEVGA
jgi:uncharacterized membrane protein YgcG